jgi:hypothetical protein
MMKNSIRVFTYIVIVLMLGACNLPEINGNGTSDISAQEAAMTAAAQTVEAQHTVNAQGQSITPSLSTGQSGETPEVTPTPTGEIPCDRAGFEKDITVEDGTEMISGEKFTKTWQVRNKGSCTWTSGYQLVFDTGDAMDGPSAQSLTSVSVLPGDILDVSVELTAPDTPGTYRGVWQMRNPQGDIFTRDGVWAEIVVVLAPPSIHSSHASFDISETADADLDEGDSPPSGGGSDFKFVAAGTKYIEPDNGATFLLMGSNEPSYNACKTAALTSNNIDVDDTLVGKWVCYKTNQGRLGRFEVVSLTPSDPNQPQTLEVSYLTWVIP